VIRLWLSERSLVLTGLLGPDRVGTPVLEETHRLMFFGSRHLPWQLKETGGEIEPLPTCALRRFRAPLPVSMLLIKKQAGLSAQLRNSWRSLPGKRSVRGFRKLVGRKSLGMREWDLELENGALLSMPFACRPMGTRWNL